jgi:DNA polymerase elongation subunit (family B)
MDTDSVFAKIDCDPNSLVRELNERLEKEFGEIEIKLEESFRRIIFGKAKKRYAGLTTKGELVIRGFEVRRSDAAEISRRVQQEVLKMICYGEPLSNVKKFVKAEIDNFENQPIEQIAIPAPIRKPLKKYVVASASIRGAKIFEDWFDEKVKPNTETRRLWIRKSKTGRDCITYPKKFQIEWITPRRKEIKPLVESEEQVNVRELIDWVKMKNICLRSKVEPILEAIGTSWEDIQSGTIQTKLFS